MARRVLIVGAGPAGMAAAVAAARSGAEVTVVDDNPAAGGQIWRGGRKKAPNTQAAGHFADFAISGAQLLSGTRIFGRVGDDVVEAERNGERLELGFDRLVLATGARERFLPFPGWTLPGVVGAGGLQALVKGGWPIAGKRVVIAGTGPLLLAVAAVLRAQGADVVAVLEQAPAASVRGFALKLWRYPGKLLQGIGLKWQLRGIPNHHDAWVTAATGAGHLAGVDFVVGGERQTMSCDYLACGFGLVPSTELAQLFGCELRDGAVAVDARQRSSQERILVAGEGTGVGGVDKALLEGEVAGLAAVDATVPDLLLRQRDAALRFVAELDGVFGLQPELRKLATAETTVCRCEDVSYGKLAELPSWREAKLLRRCGMGPCQGRVCGPACEFLFGWEHSSIRPPILPTTVGALGTRSQSAPSREPQLAESAKAPVLGTERPAPIAFPRKPKAEAEPQDGG